MSEYQTKNWTVFNGTDLSQIGDYNEIAISVWIPVQPGISSEVLYSGQFSKGQLDVNQRVFLNGGYYFTSADYGICNLNIINNIVSLRNVFYDGKNFTSSAGLRIRYR